MADQSAGLASRYGRLCRLLMWQYAWRRATRSAVRMPTDDRRILESVIFRELFLDSSFRRILFVGVSRYTAWYPRLFELSPEKWFETIDPDPRVAEFGSRYRHWVMPIEALTADKVLGRLYDVVIINGVFGYGIDNLCQKRATIACVANLLRPLGVLVVGYRDRDGIVDFDPLLVDPALFRCIPTAGLAAVQYRTQHSNGHCFVSFART